MGSCHSHIINELVELSATFDGAVSCHPNRLIWEDEHRLSISVWNMRHTSSAQAPRLSACLGGMSTLVSTIEFSILYFHFWVISRFFFSFCSQDFLMRKAVLLMQL